MSKYYKDKWARKLTYAIHNSPERIQLGMDELQYLDYLMKKPLE